MHGLGQRWAMMILALRVAFSAQTAQASLVINEVMHDGPGNDPDDVFTEPMPGMDLGGWSLIETSGSDVSAYRTVVLSGSFNPTDGNFTDAGMARDMGFNLSLFGFYFHAD